MKVDLPARPDGEVFVAGTYNVFRCSLQEDDAAGWLWLQEAALPASANPCLAS